jgi:hypothetical protein
MPANILLGLISLVLAGSPYISKMTFINEYFQFRAIGNIRGSFEIFVISLGAIGFVLALYNMFLRKKNGSPYIVIGALVLVVGFFYNDETVPMPLNNTFLGGELFFTFVVSLILAVAGLVAEWLIEQPN